jgi:hypothetical protein
MRWLQSTVLVVLLLGTLGGEPAAAEPPATAGKAPSAEVAKRAEALFQEAARLVDEKKWVDAEAKLQQAWALNPTFDIASNLGQVQARLGKYRQAATNLAFALRNWPVLTGMAEKRARAQKRLDEVRPFVASVTITVSMADAVIFVDGERVGTSPMKEEIFLDPGAHTVEATLAGHEKAAQKIEGAKGTPLTVSLMLKPVAAPSAVTGQAKPDATQAQSKQPAATAQPVKNTPVDPQPVKHEPTPQGSKPPVRTIVIGVGIGTSAALIGTGIGLAIASSQKGADVSTKLDTLEKQSGPSPCFVPWRNVSACNEVVRLSDEQSRFANGAIWTFIAGGVVGAGTLAYTLVTRKKPESIAIQVHAVAGDTGAAVMLRGRW